MRLDLILDNRLHKSEGDKFARFSESDYASSAKVDAGAFTVKERQTQLRNLVVAIGQAYGKDWR